AALSRGRLVPGAHGALRVARRARAREEEGRRGCGEPPRAVGAAAVRARRGAGPVARPEVSGCRYTAVHSGGGSQARGQAGGCGDGDMSWTDICAVDDVPVLGSRVVRRASGGDIAIFRNSKDRIFALLDRCPHKGGPLSQGIVFG